MGVAMSEETPRFTLEWLIPQELGLETHAVLYDAERHHDHVLAMGHGGDEADALLDLWTTLVDHKAPQEAIAHVAWAFTKRTGRAPDRVENSLES